MKKKFSTMLKLLSVSYGIPVGIRTDKGTILVWVMVAMTMLSGLMFAGLTALQNTSTLVQSNMEYYGQATSVAKAGLLDALGWFQRQTGQPVIAFTPQLNLGAVPPINDTDDPTIGIVRDIEIDSSLNLYGRYEVITSTVQDVSAQRGLIGNGTIWYIECIGYLYKRLDQYKAFSATPNYVLTSVKMATEIRRISMVLPAYAALCSHTPASTNINTKTVINGGTHYDIAYPSGAGAPTIAGGATVTGTPQAPQAITSTLYYDTCTQVFGLSESDLQSIADFYVTAVNQLPNTIPDYTIVFFNGSATFDATHPLKGTGIFYITGDLTIAASSNSDYNGIIYCKGVYTQHGPSMMDGSIVTQGTVTIDSTTDVSEIDYDSKVLQQVQNYTGQYRLNKGIYQIPN